ncbi:hypothetical protein CLVI_34120 [Clostridium vincentii]|uniref:Uncharacterized protein n=2 Tax=Clostridium vincentii TaxID=52704 RepID=A0A2T0B561_9CLOT|nr:hypothetical protein CLVI_34120 [Clostridium vincentii]
MGYFQCEVGFTQHNGVTQSSTVFANYAHAKLGLSGAISLSSTGGISLGFGILDKNYSIACDVDVN